MVETSNSLAYAALGAALLAGASALAPAARAADPSPTRIYMAPGTSPLLAAYEQRARREAAAAREAWLQAGHSEAEAASVAPPAITGGVVYGKNLSATVPNAYPEIGFSYTTGTPGLQSVYFIFVSPDGQSAYYATYGEPQYTTSGKIGFESPNPPALWSQPGTWTLTVLQIIDRAGNLVTYDAAQIASLFSKPSYTVVDTGTVDALAPTISGGKLLNSTVFLSATYPELHATITGSDSGSGLWLAYLIVQPPGASYSFYENVPLPLAKKSGAIDASTLFAPNDQTGTWNIVGFALCDFAQNCSGSVKQSDIVALFGTDTFNVRP